MLGDVRRRISEAGLNNTERMTSDEFKATTESAYHGKEDGFYALAHEAARARRVEQEQAEKIRRLEQQVLDLSVSLSAACNETAEFKDMLRLANERADAAENEAAHLQKRLEVAHESISFANDKMAEQVRQARWEVADTALSTTASGMARYEYLTSIRDANAPTD